MADIKDVMSERRESRDRYAEKERNTIDLARKVAEDPELAKGYYPEWINMWLDSHVVDAHVAEAWEGLHRGLTKEQWFEDWFSTGRKDAWVEQMMTKAPESYRDWIDDWCESGRINDSFNSLDGYAVDDNDLPSRTVEDRDFIEREVFWPNLDVVASEYKRLSCETAREQQNEYGYSPIELVQRTLISKESADFKALASEFGEREAEKSRRTSRWAVLRDSEENYHPELRQDYLRAFIVSDDSDVPDEINDEISAWLMECEFSGKSPYISPEEIDDDGELYVWLSHALAVNSLMLMLAMRGKSSFLPAKNWLADQLFAVLGRSTKSLSAERKRIQSRQTSNASFAPTLEQFAEAYCDLAQSWDADANDGKRIGSNSFYSLLRVMHFPRWRGSQKVDWESYENHASAEEVEFAEHNDDYPPVQVGTMRNWKTRSRKQSLIK